MQRPDRLLRSAGFTLIELMIAVACAAILASIALPSFSEYLTRGRIPMATGRLMTMQMQLEQYFQDNRTYAGAPACNSADTGNSYFSFSCPVQEAQGFLLQAAGKGPMADFVFTMDDKGTMRTASVARGWRLPQGNCWVLRRDGSC